MRIALGQFNACVGDLTGNADKMRKMYAEAVRKNVDLLVFPELALCGYPPEDLLLKKHFLDDNRKIINTLAADCTEKTVVAGFAEGGTSKCHNAAAIIQNGRITKVYRKVLLPNYGVFDEQRYFTAGRLPVVIDTDGFNVAITICRDIWDVQWLTDFLKNAGEIHLIANMSASPYHTEKNRQRKQILTSCAKKFNCAIAYCNLVGGQDELVFDGGGMFVDSSGNTAAKAKAFEEDLLIADMIKKDAAIEIKPARPQAAQPADTIAEIYQALVLGTRDYTHKNGFKKVLVGLSGGIDSAVVAAIASAALSAQNVTAITMPSRFNSAETIADAQRLAENLGIEFLSIPIEQTLKQFSSSLQSVPGWDDSGTAYENLQARIRGCILMTLSNKFDALVLTTGNKSETAVGYATLYGDTAGGFAVIKDVPKTTVYELAGYINKINNRRIIPADILNRPPSAELRAGQKDSDSLPDYDLLDKILKGYVEQDKSVEQLTESGLGEQIVRNVIAMVDRNEYKRRLSPPGIKITPKAFGRDRRLPITNRYKA